MQAGLKPKKEAKKGNIQKLRCYLIRPSYSESLQFFLLVVLEKVLQVSDCRDTKAVYLPRNYLFFIRTQNY